MNNNSNIVGTDNSKNLDNHKASEVKNDNLDNSKEILTSKDFPNDIPAHNNSSTNLNQDLPNLKSPGEQSLNKKLDATHFGDWQINCKTIDF